MTLYDELSSISSLGPAFSFINGCPPVLSSLSQEDKNVQNLWNTLATFNEIIYEALDEIRDLFKVARRYYIHTPEELASTDFDILNSVTMDKVTILDTDQCYVELSKSALEAKFHAERAARLLREDALPIIQKLEKQLSSLVFIYATRRQPARSRSWAPVTEKGDAASESGGQVQEGITQIAELSNVVSRGADGLRRLSHFLDHMGHHFRDVSYLRLRDLHSFGFATFIDFRRLYLDRLVCSFKLLEMYGRLLPLYEAFEHVNGRTEGRISSNHRPTMRFSV